jgi:hypothetical protein
MQSYRQAGTVIVVSNRSPESAVAQAIEAHGLVMQWARNIEVAVDLLTSSRDRDIYLTPPDPIGCGLTNWANGTGAVCMAC